MHRTPLAPAQQQERWLRPGFGRLSRADARYISGAFFAGPLWRILQA
jgi:hypothetical protein